jgi:TPR repeat protein
LFSSVHHQISAACRLVLIFPLLFALCGTAWSDEYKQSVSHHRNGKYAVAISLMKPLAQQGNPFAQFAVGSMYDDGLGVPQSFSHALYWYRKAADQGLADAQYILARMHGRGRGVEQNASLAFFWFNIAGAGGYPEATRLRDQHRHQISRQQQERLEAEAVKWQAHHPASFTCKDRNCIYPSWTKKPRWHELILLDDVDD